MKTKYIIGASAVPALLVVAAGLLGGCAQEPVGEYSARQDYYEHRPGMTKTRTFRGYRYGPISRTSSVEPVGERYGVETRPIGRRYRTTDGSWERVAPYGPYSPTSPSQWW